ncbi:SNF2 family N-terminal domain-containing protein, partial [Suillus americanus]
MSYLLPSTLFFDTLRKEMKETGGNTAYVPLRIITQPLLVEGGEMKDYQLQGLAFLIYMYKNGMNCILGDGNSFILSFYFIRRDDLPRNGPWKNTTGPSSLWTLSLFAHIQENEPGRHDPHLIICPLSVLSSWQNEAARWVPSLRVFRFHSTQSERGRLKNSVRNDKMKFDLCITTYEAYVCEDSWFKSRRWFYCVLDEGHRIKNSDTNLFGKIRGLGSLYRLILTGTPVQNNLVELWGLLNWLYPTIFTPPSQQLFQESFDLSRGSYSIPFLKAAQELLLVIMMRRTKANVDIAVPPHEELTLFIPITEAQRFWTYRLLTRMDTMDLEEIFTEEDGLLNEGRKEVFSHIASAINRNVSGETNRWRKLMNLLMQLHKVCDHPYMLKDASPSPYIIGEHVVASSSKLIVIDKVLADTLPKGVRVLIFSQWTSMLNLLDDYMELRSIPYGRLDGGTTRPRQNLDIKLFQQEKSPYQVFLVSTKAGGLGSRKMFLSLKVMSSSTSSSSANEDNTQLKTTELLDILRKGSSALSRSDVGMDLGTFLKAPIQEVLDDSREQEGVRDVKLKKEMVSSHDTAEDIDEKTLLDAEEEERKLLSSIAQVQSRLFEGKLIKRNQNNNQIAQEWQELQKRARIDRTVVVDGITVIADHMGQSAPEEISPASKKKSKAKYETEDWCVYCRDGGDVVLCTSCPRVFHPKCHGITTAQLRKLPMVHCPQHKCSACDRSTAEAGGMLFRCQTCPQ